MKIAVIQFPGSNCERETKLALKRSGLTPVDVFWNAPIESLSEHEGYVIVGGFSYEDRIRSGLIAAQNTLIKALRLEAEKGKPILGICNGAQILVESGLVAGSKNGRPLSALTKNVRLHQGKLLESGFHNDWCYLKPFALKETHAFTNRFKPGETIFIPFANAEGRFILTPEGLDELLHNESQLLQYCNKNNEIIDEYPINPNGSTLNLAAISNKNGNVMAIMPHPERCEGGQIIFDSMRAYLEKQNRDFSHQAFNSEAPSINLRKWQPNPNSESLIIDAVIEDNSAKTLELLLQNEGFNTRIKRYRHYQLKSTTSLSALLNKLENSDLLWNPNKEMPIHLKPSRTFRVLVGAKDNPFAKQKLNTLQTYFKLDALLDLNESILFEIESLDNKSEALQSHLLTHHLLFNPLTEDGYDYNHTP